MFLWITSIRWWDRLTVILALSWLIGRQGLRICWTYQDLTVRKTESKTTRFEMTCNLRMTSRTSPKCSQLHKTVLLRHKYGAMWRNCETTLDGPNTCTAASLWPPAATPCPKETLEGILKETKSRWSPNRREDLQGCLLSLPLQARALA